MGHLQQNEFQVLDVTADPRSAKIELTSLLVIKFCNLAVVPAQETETMPPRSHTTCPQCGLEIDERAPQGMCTKCVLLWVATAIREDENSTGDSSPVSMSYRPGGQLGSPEEIGEYFDDLEVLELLGAGGMGAVYKARQTKLDRTVALKILSRELASDSAFQERFDREARLLARLHHPNIVTIFETGTKGPFAYLIMEFVDGQNLREAMEGERMKPAAALTLVRDICEPLKFAHEQGILHRDIKPENILISSRGEVKIADFGIGKLVGDADAEKSALTGDNAVLGSLRYMSPEQIDSPADVDQRADIYSLGLVLYELLTGQVPMGRFEPPSKSSSVESVADEIVMQALERDLRARIPTMAELQLRLEELTSTTGPGTVIDRSRLGTHAAICTGISLALALICIAYFMMMLEQKRTNIIRDSTLYLIGAVELVIVGVPAVLGMLLGWRALAELRAAPGRTRGLDTALVGALPWPLLLGFMTVGGTLWSVADALGTAIPLPLFVMTSVLLGGFLAARIAIRVFRWVKGESA